MYVQVLVCWGVHITVPHATGTAQANESSSASAGWLTVHIHTHHKAHTALMSAQGFKSLHVPTSMLLRKSTRGSQQQAMPAPRFKGHLALSLLSSPPHPTQINMGIRLQHHCQLRGRQGVSRPPITQERGRAGGFHITAPHSPPCALRRLFLDR
jgi:hypothetical protein